MTVMMLGVVQIFAIVTQTAGDAEGLHFAREQQRALFDMLHRDFDGLTREGYLKIVKNPTAISDTKTYAIDVLAMTTVGAFAGAWGPTENPSAYKGTAAEVIYTTNVRTPTEVLKVSSAAGDVKVDRRKGILGRGVWIFSGQAATTVPDINLDDRTKTATLAEYAASTISTQRCIDDSKLTVGSAPGLTVWPTSSRTGLSGDARSLRRVMTTCTSDFMVEVLEYGTATPTSTTIDGKYYWRPVSLFNTGTTANDWRPGLVSTTPSQRPRAVRVTVATHAPDERLPLPKDKDASGNLIYERYRGYVLQEVFWIRDP
jgi:hypothetical protein